MLNQTTNAFVDDSGADRFVKIILARCATGVDKTNLAHVAICNLIAGQIDGRSDVRSGETW